MSEDTYVETDETAEALVAEWERQDQDFEYGLVHADDLLTED